MGASFPRSGLAQSRDLGHVRDHAGAWTNGSLSRPPNLRADQTRKFHEDLVDRGVYLLLAQLASKT